MTDNNAERASLEEVGSAALDRFIETFNSRDAAAWAASLSYPHVRISPRQTGAIVTSTAQAYAEAVSYDAADAMGWHHSAWDTRQILAVSPSKIHASAQWCRYNADGERILPNNVSYVITKVDGQWGIQARFGVDSQPPSDTSVVVDAVRRVWTRWWESVASRGTEGSGEIMRYPLAIIGTGEVHQATTPEEVQRRLGDWAETATVGDITPLQVGERGVNVGVQLAGADGRGVHGLFLVAGQDTRRVAAASLLHDPR